MTQNTIASKIRHHSRLVVQSSSVGNRSLYPFTSCSSSLLIPSLEGKRIIKEEKRERKEVVSSYSTILKEVIGVKDIILPTTSSSLSSSISSLVNDEVRERRTMIASDIEHLEDSVIVNIVVRMSSIFVDLHLPKVEDFEELPQAVVDHLKRKEEAKEIAERCFISDIRKRNPLLHVMAELRINKTLITLGNLLVSSFLHSFILSMRKETREHVIERINVFDIGDDRNFDIRSFQNLVFQTNYMLTFLDEHNDKETFFGIFRLYKRNLYRFWYNVGMTLRHNLDYHWKKIMRDSCKTAEEEEMKKATVDDGQKQLEECIKKLKKKSSSSKRSTGSSNSKKKRRKICRVEEEEQPEEDVQPEEEEQEEEDAVDERRAKEEEERRVKEEEERRAKEEEERRVKEEEERRAKEEEERRAKEEEERRAKEEEERRAKEEEERRAKEEEERRAKEEEERRAKEEEERRAKEEERRRAVNIAEVVRHTCGFATQYVTTESLKTLVRKNRQMRRMMNDIYFDFLASPDTIFV